MFSPNISFDTFWTLLISGGYLLTMVLIPWVIILKKRHTVSTIAWIMAIVILPYIGAFFFLVFGVNRVQRRTARKLDANLTMQRLLPGVAAYQLISGERLTAQQQRLMQLANRLSDTLPTQGNQIELLPDTNRTLALIEQAIESAQNSLHLEYYIWRPDKTGTRLRDMLIAKAKEGIKIRFLYDGIGSIHLRKKFLNSMRDAGIQVAAFLPGASVRERWSVNLRNHRKIVIADGRVGFTGGMNIGDEYLGRNRNIGYWRDTHLRMEGPCVLQLQQVFAEDWYYATGEELTHPDLYPAPEASGNVAAQVVVGGPDQSESLFHMLMFAAINEAQHRITIETSYFVPPDSVVTALVAAALRGVRVRLLLAGKANYIWTVLAGRSYYDSLLHAGIEIHEYARGLLHSKTMTIDGDWSLVGTPNLDSRSLLLNFENAVIMYDSRIAALLEEHYVRDVRDAIPIRLAEWEKRPLVHKLAENTCRLFSPVL
ncbi:MAG: cardiolipin synthase [Planctomycetota bacterium]|nr:cardiolipin synthase [Planctomycetota bacterium]MDA1211347.1 cardiolipin synthase [Planctomycetota bacterium]